VAGRPGWWRALVLAAMALPAVAVELAELPALPRPRAPVVAATPEPQWLAPGIGIIRDQAVVLTGTRWVDSGPDEGLAIVAALTSGRLHETLVRLASDDAKLLKSAFILAFGWNDGDCNDALHGLPPRGVPVRVSWEWRDEADAVRRIDISCLVRDRTSDRAFPPLPFLYTGSRVGEQRLRERDGSERMVPSFKLAEHRTLIALFDEHDALLSTPLPFVSNDLHLEVNTGLAPPGRSAGRLVMTPATLPLVLTADGPDALRQGDGPILDDAALAALLAKHYPSEDPALLHAVGIRPTDDRTMDPLITKRILQVAITGKVWVLPVFVR
jgi:hypothetical protein